MMLSRKALNVQARSTTARVKQAAAKPEAPKQATALSILKKVESLKLLSQVEKAGLLSKLEKSGLTLSKIEESGLLSLAENSGVLSLVADKNTPGLLNLTGATLLAATAALIYFVGDESTAEVALQAVGGLVLGGAGIAALVAASTLDDFQKL